MTWQIHRLAVRFKSPIEGRCLCKAVARSECAKDINCLEAACVPRDTRGTRADAFRALTATIVMARARAGTLDPAIVEALLAGIGLYGWPTDAQP